MTLKQRPATQTVPEKMNAQSRLAQGFHACRPKTAEPQVRVNMRRRNIA
jgi:hypothetical protein